MSEYTDNQELRVEAERHSAEATALDRILRRPQDVEEASTGSLPHLDAELVLLRLRDAALLRAQRGHRWAEEDALEKGLASNVINAHAARRRRVEQRLHEAGFSSVDFLKG